MEKKPEEIMAIVLDYCHHACPEIGKNVPLYEGAYLKKDIDGYGIYHYWGSDRGNATCICTVPTRSTFIANPNVFTAFYKLLGLDKRDALEAHTRKEAEFEARMNLMDAKQEKYMDLYRAERGKLAKLIEALEEINNVPTKMQESIDIYKESGYQLKTDSELVEKIAEFGFGELEFHTADIERLVTQSGIAFNALEAYKEGKKDEN